jgi:integrase
MSKILLLLQTVHQTVHQNRYQLKIINYSTPKIYSGGVNVSLWNTLSKIDQEKALAKDWYVYYKFIDGKTGQLKRMPNIKAGANRFKTKKERIQILSYLREALEELLEKGLNPLEINDLSQFDNKDIQAPPKNEVLIKSNIAIETAEPTMSIKEAFEFALKIKKSTLNETSYSSFQGKIKRFMKTLDENNSITSISKKIANQYLNGILEASSPRNRNNTRIDLSSLFEVLASNEIIPDNFIKKINVIKSKPERNKTYTPEMQADIYSFLEKNDPILLLFIKFVSYNFLRPIEVCRLKVGDLDIIDKKLYVKAKNKAVKIKIIPEILIKDLPDLTKLDKNHFLFTPTKIGGEWDATENNRRDNFSKRFKSVVKEHFELGIDYGMYSFRHTFISRLYRELRKNYSPFEAKSKLLLITGHFSMTSLEQYLRDIDAELPEDYSHLLQ